METEENGKKRKKTEETEKIGSDTVPPVPATPFSKSRQLTKIFKKTESADALVAEAFWGALDPCQPHSQLQFLPHQRFLRSLPLEKKKKTTKYFPEFSFFFFFFVILKGFVDPPYLDFEELRGKNVTLQKLLFHSFLGK